MRTHAPLLFVAGLVGAGCSSFDPNLGTSPYLCAVVDPANPDAARCPDGYACMADGNGKEVCILPGGMPPDTGSGSNGFQCQNDGPLEPNDTIAMAYQTDVGAGAQMRAFGPISVCPEGDKDHYQVNVSSPNQGLEVITRWDSGPAIGCSILNAAGTSIANGTAMGQNALRACATNLPVGLYYGVAFSALSMKNNYRIELRIVANCQ